LPVKHACIALLHHTTLDLITAHNLWLPNIRDLKPTDYRIKAVLQDWVYCARCRWVEV